MKNDSLEHWQGVADNMKKQYGCEYMVIQKADGSFSVYAEQAKKLIPDGANFVYSTGKQL